MRQEEFNNQMLRLIANYGKPSYSAERCALIWRDTMGLDAKLFERIVDGFISDAKFAPLGNDFREAMAKERERANYTEKRQHEKDAKEFYSIFQAEDIQTLCKAIQKKCAGEMGDAEYASFVKNLKNVVDTTPGASS